MEESSSSRRSIVESYLASFDDRDPAAIAAHVSDDFHNVGASALGAMCTGRPAYLERLPGFLESLPGLHYEIEQLVVEGEQVAAFYTMTGRWLGEAPFEVRGVQRLRVVDGQITERTDYWDNASFLVQVDSAAREALAPFGI